MVISDGRPSIRRTRPGRGAHGAYGVGRDHGAVKLVAEVQAGVGDLQQRQQLVRTVAREEVVVEAGGARLPRVHDQPADLLRRQRKLVLPQVAALDVRVLLDLHVVRHDVEAAGESAGQPLQRVKNAVFRVDVGGEVDDVVQEEVPLASRARQAQERVAVHRRRAVDVRGRVDQRRRLRRDARAPEVVVMASRVRRAGGVDAQRPLQPVPARREPALRVPSSSGLGAKKARSDAASSASGSRRPAAPARKNPSPSASLFQPPPSVGR